MPARQADFSFFFDAGGRRRCYIAPERFYESAGADAAMLASQPLDPAMVRFAHWHPLGILPYSMHQALSME